MRRDFLDILVCPVKRTPLEQDSSRGELISDAAGLAYPMVEGFPVLVPARARKLGSEGPAAPARERLEETSEYAARYHEVRHHVPGTVVYEDYWNRRLIDLLPKERHLRALDLMCGDGLFLPVLDSLYDQVYGMDLSVEMLKHVDLSRRDRVCAGDALAMPFSGQVFDVVIVRGGLHHLPDRLGEVMAEIGRVLKPGGRLVFLEPCDDNLLIRGFRRAVYRLSPHFDEDEERGLTTRELRARLEEAGFRPLRVERSGFLGYALLLNTDMSGILRTLNSAPWSRPMARALIAFDSLWEKTPVLGSITFNLFLSAAKEKAE